jgi:hypothetical protein
MINFRFLRTLKGYSLNMKNVNQRPESKAVPRLDQMVSDWPVEAHQRVPLACDPSQRFQHGMALPEFLQSFGTEATG